jgi:hypothetical protein
MQPRAHRNDPELGRLPGMCFMSADGSLKTIPAFPGNARTPEAR